MLQLKSVLEAESFSCTRADTESLLSHIELYGSTINSADRFKRSAIIERVLEVIPCEGDGIKTRKFLAKNVKSDLSVVRCS